ncbi:MAG: DUF692 domain-containing protein [Tepidisphaeraceae bacterium]
MTHPTNNPSHLAAVRGSTELAEVSTAGSAATPAHLGLGIGWRPEIALTIDRRRDLGFVEITAEHFPGAQVPPAIDRLRERGLAVIPHGISLSLGGAEPVDRDRVRALGDLAKRVGAPLVSEHIAFVRAGGIESGHLLPVSRTRAGLEVVVENVKVARDLLPVPLALENISILFDWPGAEMAEAEFVTEILERTDSLLLLDIANVWANAKNLGGEERALLRDLPLNRLAYVHVGGGEERDGVYHDTHAAPVPAGVFDLVESLCTLTHPPGVMIERDDDFPPDWELEAELDRLARAVQAGAERRRV